MTKWCRNSSNPTTGGVNAILPFDPFCNRFNFIIELEKVVKSRIFILIVYLQVAQYKLKSFSLTCSCCLSKFEVELLM